MPSACALRVMSLAKVSSSPPMCSATTTAASFAERVTMPLMESSTLMVWPSRKTRVVELELAGLELLEQEIERHDLGERGRMPERVRIGGMQDRAGIAVDHDVRIARLFAAAGLAGGEMLAVGARVGRAARCRKNGHHRDEAEDSAAKPAQGSDSSRQHASPRPLLPLRRFWPSTHPCICWLRKGQAKKGKIW